MQDYSNQMRKFHFLYHYNNTVINIAHNLVNMIEQSTSKINQNFDEKLNYGILDIFRMTSEKSWLKFSRYLSMVKQDRHVRYLCAISWGNI